MRIIQSLTDYAVEGDVCLLKTNTIPVKILFMTADIIRIRAGFEPDFAEASYSLVMTAWEDRMDNLFKQERRRVSPQSFQITEEEEQIILKGSKLTCIIKKNPFQISVWDEEDTCLYADIAGIGYMEDSNRRRLHFSEIEQDDCFYGFGEKGGAINKLKTAMKLSGKDAMGYDPEKTDGLYKHIPFYIKLGRQTKKAVGLFYHNTYECEFNMGREKSNYWHYYSKYTVDGGDIDLFIINGPEIAAVVERYTDLTGKSALLPIYALGYLGSSMYYPELDADCDDEILEFIKTNQAEGIPIDGFQLSSGYTVQEHNKRCTFTWNYKRFKNPESFFAAMEAEGVTVTPNVKPGFLLEHPLFEEMKAQDMFVKSSDGQGIGTGSWWGGEGAFADFTKAETRERWKEYLKETVILKGTSSIWNDNCEYDSLVDKDCICDFDGRQGTIGELKPVMANLMCKITEEAVTEAMPGTRPYIVCRAGYSGIQRYAQTWAGDNLTCYEALKYNIATILGMGLSGVANQGCDIGGFYGPAPEAELFIRWVQNGIFQPRFSIHSVNTDNTVTEPWMYPKYTHYIRDAIKLRYRLIPYLYSLMAMAHKTGAPIMRPLFYEFQEDERCYDEGVDFMEGKSLFIANVVEQGAAFRPIYFPRGSRYFDFYTRKEYQGGEEIQLPVELSSIPMFVRSGGIIPYAVNELSNLHQDKVTALGILIEPSEDGEFTLYEDDGKTMNYAKGDYRETLIRVSAGEQVKICFCSRGEYQSPVQSLYIDLISKQKGPYYVTVDGQELPHYLYAPKFREAKAGWYYDHSLKSVQLKWDGTLRDMEIIVSFEQFDMIGM